MFLSNLELKADLSMFFLRFSHVKLLLILQVDASLSVLTSATVNHAANSGGNALSSKISTLSTLVSILVVTFTVAIVR